MKKDISKDEKNTIAVYDGVLYEYYDESWHEKEFQSIDEQLSKVKNIKTLESDAIKLMYKNCKVAKSLPRLLISTSKVPRVTPGYEALMKRLISIPFSTENGEEDITKES